MPKVLKRQSNINYDSGMTSPGAFSIHEDFRTARKQWEERATPEEQEIGFDSYQDINGNWVFQTKDRSFSDEFKIAPQSLRLLEKGYFGDSGGNKK